MICFDGAFHGRTLAMLSATGNAKYLDGFGPPVDGFDHVPFGNMNAVRTPISPQTAGILVEPIQGEGGVRVAADRFPARSARRLRRIRPVPASSTRCSAAWAAPAPCSPTRSKASTPDVLSAAKGIAGGFPMGAILATERVAKHLSPGSHGTTFGGNPLAAAAANAVLDVVLAPGFLAQVAARGRRLANVLHDLVARRCPKSSAGCAAPA